MDGTGFVDLIDMLFGSLVLGECGLMKWVVYGVLLGLFVPQMIAAVVEDRVLVEEVQGRLLMRTPDADQKLDVERGAWKALGEQGAGTTLQGEGGRRRASRRGMKLAGQKSSKQPQRGLGVAQLEKLRMQEQQSKCSVGQNQYLHHIKAGPAPLAFGNSRPPDKAQLLAAAKELGHMMHAGTRVDDVLWTFMSPAHSRSVSLSRLDEHGRTVMSIMVPLGRDERGTCNHDHHHPRVIPVPLQDRPPSRVVADHNPSSPGTSVDRLLPLPAGNGDKSEELSSVQNIVSSNVNPRSSKSCGWKRPWQALLDPNESSRFAAAMNSGHDVALGHQTSAHQSEGTFIRPEDCSTHPLKIRTRPSEFLTLGLPSYNPGISARVQSQEANRSRVEMCSKGVDDSLQLHLCNPQVQRMQSYPEARLSYKFSSGSLTEECHKQMELRKTEESLDLRLKLAI